MESRNRFLHIVKINQVHSFALRFFLTITQTQAMLMRVSCCHKYFCDGSLFYSKLRRGLCNHPSARRCHNHIVTTLTLSVAQIECSL